MSDNENGFQPQTESQVDSILSSLRQLRKAKGISQVELATMVGCTQQGISKIEKGKKSPSLHTFGKILTALDVEIKIERR